MSIAFNGQGMALPKKSIFTARYQRLRTLLVEARGTVGLTQAQLASKLSRPQSFVSKYERGERRLDLIELMEVCDALGVQPTQIIKKLK